MKMKKNKKKNKRKTYLGALKGTDSFIRKNQMKDRF